MTTLLIVQAQAETYARALAGAYPQARFLTAATPQAAIGKAADAQVVLAMAQDVTPALVAAMPKLRWIGALTTGTDPIDGLDLAQDVVVTSGRGIHGPQMAELCFHLMFALLRQTPRMVMNQRAHVWERWPQRLLLGKTLVVVGVGQISEELALRAQVFGMRTVGVSSARSEARGFDAIVARDQLGAAAAQADILVALVPLSAATVGMIDDAILSAMRPDAFIINLARGPVVDEAALIRHLRAGTIAGAGLDVFDREPLPVDSPLWDLPNVVITPHVGGMSDTYAAQIMPLVIENVGHFLAGRATSMRNIVPRSERAS